MLHILHQNFSGDQIKDDITRTCSKYGGEKRFWWENLREGARLKDPDVNGKIILKWILEKWDEDME
jgi:hypothetical protein